MTPRPSIFLADPAHEIAVALFGKHPLAADHLEDIGLSTASLVSFKQGFYVDGIAECLGRQAWFKDLGTTDAIPYDHSLLCSGPAGFIMARLVHSADAAGRKQYPLVLALHSGDFTLLNQVGLLSAKFETTMEQLREAADMTALRQIQMEIHKTFEEMSRSSRTWTPPTTAARESWLQHLPPGNDDHEGLWRCCHALLPEGAGSGRARLPIHTVTPWPSITLWAAFLRQLCGPNNCFSFLWHHGSPFADIWLTPPGARVLSSMFANEATHPLTTQVPYNLNETIRSHAESVLATWLKQDALFQPADDLWKNFLKQKRVCHRVLHWFKWLTAR